MPRLIDELRSPKTRIAMPYFVSANYVNDYIGVANQAKQLIDLDLPVIVIDNVAKYMSFTNGKKTWSLKNFPNLAPPYKLFWCEYGRHTSPVGVLVFYQKPDKISFSTVGQLLHQQFDDVAWEISLIPYFNGHDTGPIGPYGRFGLYVDATGKILGPVQIYNLIDKNSQDEQEQVSLSWCIYPVLLAICFMHCKNIVIKENSVDLPIARKYQARYGVTPVNYKTLIIEPLKSILRREGRSDEVGLEKAMHICRGHFSDYSQGNGLFGKYPYRDVWMPDMVRGTKGKAPKSPEIEVLPPKIGF